MRNYLVLLMALSFLFVFSNCNSAYNNLDPNSVKYVESVPVPLLYSASDGSYTGGVYLFWSVLNSEFKIYVYRSERKDGDYVELNITNEYNVAVDKSAIPGKIYYYKIKVFYYGLGESGYSNIESGYRAGNIEDQYESDDTTSDAKEFIPDNGIQSRTLYPENDCDWVKLQFERNNYYNIEILSTGKSNDDAQLSFVLYDERMTELKKVTSESEKKILYYLPGKTSTHYLLIYSGTTGDYNLKIYKKNEKPVVSVGFSASDGESSNYIKLVWSSVLNADYYNLYKSLTKDGDFKKIKFYRSKTGEEKYDMTTKNYCFDKDVVCDVKYFYKLEAVNCFGSSYFDNIESGYIKDLTADKYESNDVMDDAKEIEVGKSLVQSHTIYGENDIDYFKFNALSGNYYSIEVLFGSSEIDNANLLLTNKAGIMLEQCYLKNTIGTYKIRNWYCDQTSDYYIKLNLLNNFIDDYKIRVISFKEDNGINDF